MFVMVKEALVRKNMRLLNDLYFFPCRVFGHFEINRISCDAYEKEKS